MKRNNYWALLALSFALSGCWDIIKEKSVDIIGSISLINPRNQEDVSYRLVYYDKSKQININLTEDYVRELYGNDTILLVKSQGKTDCHEIFYRISHNKGFEPFKVIPITANDYAVFLAGAKYEYQFAADDEVPACP